MIHPPNKERAVLMQTGTAKRPGRWHYAILAAVMILAGVLRLGGITRVGIRYDDEACYTTDARLWHRCASVMIDPQAIAALWNRDKKAFQQRLDEHGVDFTTRFHPKQGYTFLAALMMFVVGDRPAGVLATNALLGTLSVLVLYGIAAVLFGRSVALCAAFFLAVSGYHIVYSRSAYTDTTMGFFMLLGIFFWVLGLSRGWGRRRTYGLCGMALGYALACHFRSLYVFGVVILTDMIVAFTNRRETNQTTPAWRDLPARWGWMAIGVAVPLLAIESLFQAARLAARLTDSHLPLYTFLESAFHLVQEEAKFGAARGAADGFWHLNTLILPAYASYFAHWHGWVACVLGLGGLLVVLRSKTSARGVALMLLVPISVLMFQPYLAARAISATVPFFCVCVAVGLIGLLSGVSRRMPRCGRAMTLGLAALVAIPAIQQSIQLYGKRSQLADACAFVANVDGPVVTPIETCPRSKYLLYLDDSNKTLVRANLHALGSPKDVIEHLKDEGVRWIMTDPQLWHYRDENYPAAYGVFRWWQALGKELQRSATLVAEFPHIQDFQWEFLAEGPGADALTEMRQDDGGPLRIYDLRPTEDNVTDASVALVAQP